MATGLGVHFTGERVEPYRSDKPGVRARTSTRGWSDQFVTGSVKKDHFVQLRMHRLQSCISSQYLCDLNETWVVYTGDVAVAMNRK